MFGSQQWLTETRTVNKCSAVVLLSLCMCCAVSLFVMFLLCVCCTVSSLSVCVCVVVCVLCITFARLYFCIIRVCYLRRANVIHSFEVVSAGMVMSIHQGRMRAQLAMANSCSDKLLFTFLVSVIPCDSLLLLPHALVLLLVVCVAEGTRTFLCGQFVSVYLCMSGMDRHYPVVLSYYSICALLVLCVLFFCCVHAVCAMHHRVLCVLLCVLCVSLCLSCCLHALRSAMPCCPCPLPCQRYEGTHCRTLILFNNLSR